MRWRTYYNEILTAALSKILLPPENKNYFLSLFLLQATFEGWMELMDDAVDSKEVFVALKYFTKR